VSGANAFRELIARVRAGDPAAAAELVRLYEPAIRRAARVRLVDTRLERLLDSMDICQAVFGSFFVRVAAGQYELDKPQQLVKLLVNMARNKLADEARKHAAERRDNRRVVEGGLEKIEVADRSASPSEHLTGQELLQEFRSRLSETERELADWRAQGQDWEEIAGAMGGKPEALRKRLTRAVERVSRELGLEV
jgi:RNA polymerase sigma-70 factor (ECF subfamily)